jgi:high-affinity iron transporter
VNTPLWEGITGLVAAVFVFFLVIHMWRRAPYMKKDMEAKLSSASLGKPLKRAFLGVFLFTAFMITREGMETALLIFQVRQPGLITGMILGVLAAGVLSFLWIKLGHLINLKLFFQVTALFLLLFVGQILLFSFHEFTEAGIFPNSEALHIATEPYSPDGVYGRWISLSIVLVCSVWLFTAWVRDFVSRKISIREK